jgi:hypothetical protein
LANVILSPKGRCKCGGPVFVQGSHSATCSPMPALLAFIGKTILSVPGIDLEALGRVPVRGSKWEMVGVW